MMVADGRSEKEKQNEGMMVLAEAQQKMADYALTLELLGDLVRDPLEEKIIDGVFQLFTAIFALEKMIYIPFENGESREAQVYPGGVPDDAEIEKILSREDGEYDLGMQERGFRLQIRHQSETLGVLWIDHIAFPEYWEHYLELAFNIVRVCGLAIQNARTYRQFRQAEESARINLALQRLRNEVLQMESEESWDHVVLCFYEELKKLVDFNACSINLVDLEKDEMRAHALNPEKGLVQNFRKPIPPGVVRAIESGQVVYRPNRGDVFFVDTAPFPFPENVHSILDVPFAGGTVAINSTEENGFDERDIEIVERCASVLSQAHRRLEDLKGMALQEQHLRRAQHLALVEQLATGVAHEINNPLTLVLGYSKLLLKGEMEKEMRERVEAIYEGGMRATSIAQRLLTFSQQQKDGKREANLSDVVRESLDLVRYELAADRVQLAEELEENLPLASMHTGQVQQVVLNLVQNSRDAILEGGEGGRILVRTRSREDRVVLEVEDDGPGIPEKLNERIFEPFFTTREVGKGAGLGLSVCQSIVRENGGWLWSVLRDKGALLVMELPVISDGKPAVESGANKKQ
jgi:signal transduction histidine kinase